MSADRDSLLKKYPWLAITTTVEDYVAPEYYDRLLKPYRFGGKDDITLFEDFLGTLQKRIFSALELGPGTGRITNIVLRNKDVEQITLVDLSSKMISYLKSKFSNRKNISFKVSDSLEYLKETSGQYNLIYSLWSFSHSIHQLLSRITYEDGRAYVLTILEKAITENLVDGGDFYLIHFDTDSDEQRILVQQWAREYPFYNDEHRNPSRIFIEETFLKLEQKGVIELTIKHHTGDPIIYKSVDEALEIFLNFHLESHFNEKEYIGDIIEEMKDYFARFTDASGMISIRPACYTYQIKKRAS